MSLLREIQDEATKSNSDVLVLLRKCKVLSSRLKHARLGQWVQQELDGYSADDELPEYRKTFVHNNGHFSGPLGSGLRNAEIPSMCIPEEYREIITTVSLREGIGAYSDLVDSDESSFKLPWSANLTAIVAGNIYERMRLMQAWQVLPRGTIINLIETVKTRVLNFALELEAEDPNAGESLTNSTNLSSQKVTQIFNTTIQGNVGNLASGSSHFSQNSEMHISQGNISELLGFLKSIGVKKVDLVELEKAVEEDGPIAAKKGFGKCVMAWLGSMTVKAASGVLAVTKDVATALLVGALNKYYGFPTS